MQSNKTSVRIFGKRPRFKATKRVHKQARSKSENEVQAFINGTGARGGPPIKADVSFVRARKSYIATWEHMEQQGLDPEADKGIWEPPMHGMNREEFEACASTLRVKGTGKVCALVFPLWSRVITNEEYEALDSDDRCSVDGRRKVWVGCMHPRLT